MSSAFWQSGPSIKTQVVRFGSAYKWTGFTGAISRHDIIDRVKSQNTSESLVVGLILNDSKSRQKQKKLQEEPEPFALCKDVLLPIDSNFAINL